MAFRDSFSKRQRSAAEQPGNDAGIRIGHERALFRRVESAEIAFPYRNLSRKMSAHVDLQIAVEIENQPLYVRRVRKSGKAAQTLS